MSLPIATTFTDTVTTVVAAWLNRMQEMMTGLAWNFRFQVSGATVTLPAAAGSDAMCCVINGKQRYIEVPISFTFTGANSNGDYNIYARIAGGDVDPAFSLTAATSAPSADSRVVATCTWNGTAISNFVSKVVDVTTVGDIVPAGSIMAFGGSASPSGFLICDGTSYLRATYPRLFNAVGTAWGAADGTHFNVPDLRGKAGIGAGAGAGLTNRILAAAGGAESVALTAAQVPLKAHTHTASSGNDTPDHAHSGSTDVQGAHAHGYNVETWGINTTSGVFEVEKRGGSPVPYSTDVQGAHSHGVSVGGASARHTHPITVNPISDGSAGAAHSIMPPFAVVNYIIKF